MSRDEINRLLAEKVMGWTLEPRTNDSWFADGGGNIMSDPCYWKPYDNIAQAMMVAGEVIAMGYVLESHVAQSGCSARFFESDAVCFPIARSDTLSAAICMAALKVVEND